MDAMDSRQRVVIDFVELGLMRRMEMERVDVPVIEGRLSSAPRAMAGAWGASWLWNVGLEAGGAGCAVGNADCVVMVAIESALSVRGACDKRCGLVEEPSVLPSENAWDIRCGLTRSPSVLSEFMAWDRRYGLFEGRRVSSCSLLGVLELAWVPEVDTSSLLGASEASESR